MRGSLNSIKPFWTAFTTLTGLEDPVILDKMFVTPTNSNTALTAPPAIIPVPGEAGFNINLTAPYLIFNSWGIVEFTIAALKIFFLASSFALFTADATSFALPKPTPTCPCHLQQQPKN